MRRCVYLSCLLVSMCRPPTGSSPPSPTPEPTPAAPSAAATAPATPPASGKPSLPTREEFEKRWHMENRQDIIDALGPPDRVLPYDRGAAMWVYDKPLTRDDAGATMLIDLKFGNCYKISFKPVGKP